MKKTKILALTTDRGFGGAERVFNTLNNALLQDYEAEECFFNFGDKSYFETGCFQHELGVKGGGSIFKKLFGFFQRIYRFRKLISSTKADIVISHLEGADYVSLLSGTKAKKICVIHGTKYGDKKIVGFRGMIRKKLMIPFVYAMSDRIVTVSEALVEEIREHVHIDPSKVSHIYNAIDKDKIRQNAKQPVEETLEHLFSKKTIIASSRLDNAQKNLFGLIDMFSQINKDQEVRLIVVGDGVDRDKVLEYAELQGLSVASVWENTLDDRSADVYFIGYRSNPFSYISRADLFVSSSFYEGFPLSLLEAMACGTVVVASDCPTGPSEILQGSTINSVDELESKAYAGALLPIPLTESQETIALWVSVIGEMLHNEMLRQKMIRNGQERLELLSPERIYHEWKALIESLERA